MGGVDASSGIRSSETTPHTILVVPPAAGRIMPARARGWRDARLKKANGATRASGGGGRISRSRAPSLEST